MNFIKPRYRWNARKGFTQSWPTELTKSANQTGVPDWMKRANSTGATLGNIDSSDLKPPKLKLLAGMSPEVMDGIPGAAPGNFWMTILNQNLGQSVVITPILLRKSYHIWAPKTPANADQRGRSQPPRTVSLGSARPDLRSPLPQQSDDLQMEDRQAGDGQRRQQVRLLAARGSQVEADGDADLRHPRPRRSAQRQEAVAVWTSARTGVGPTQNFISTVMAMGVDQFYQSYRVVVLKKPGPSGDPYFTYDYQYIGNVQSEEEGAAARALYDQYRKSGFITDLEGEAGDIASSRPRPEPERVKDDDSDEIPF